MSAKSTQVSEETKEENVQIDSGEIIRELRRSGSGFKDIDDYLEEFEDEDR